LKPGGVAEHPLLGRDTGTVVTVGTFDGVHRGHWRVLQALCAVAEQTGLPSVLVTFDPHPLAIVRPDEAPALLSTPAEKIEVLAESGVNYVVVVRFDSRLAAFPPERFVEEYLIRRFAMRHLVIGYDHGFGRGRSGDAATLQQIGRALGFDVDVVGPIADDGEPISSSRIRRALAQGNVEAAAHALGRPYALRGTVVRGDGRGRDLGFPTANLRLRHPDKLVPLAGIYAARAQLRSGVVDGVVHIGPRPTFPGSASTIEVHLFDFNQDLYGVEFALSFCARLRDVQRFATVPELIAAVSADCRAARAVFAAGAGACAGSGNGVSLNG
jgi:riboflavin kinase/FMN adenylyltransferase